MTQVVKLMVPEVGSTVRIKQVFDSGMTSEVVGVVTSFGRGPNPGEFVCLNMNHYFPWGVRSQMAGQWFTTSVEVVAPAEPANRTMWVVAREGGGLDVWSRQDWRDPLHGRQWWVRCGDSQVYRWDAAVAVMGGRRMVRLTLDGEVAEEEEGVDGFDPLEFEY